MPECYFFLAGAPACFNHNRIASATALLRAPFSASYFSITAWRSSFRRSSGNTSVTFAMHVTRHLYTATSIRLYFPCESCTYIHLDIQQYDGIPTVQRISIDAEVVELRLPEDRRIQVKSAEDLATIARKVGKPILHEVVHIDPYPAGSKPILNGSHVLAVYDGPWVYYCELKAEEQTGEGPPQ